MKFNPTPLECVLFIFVYLAIYIWTKHGRRLRRWLKDYFRQRRGPRNLKPKSPVDCPACNRDCSLLPEYPKLEVLPWPDRKSRRGRPKVIDTAGHACLNPSCDYFAIADPAIHALVSNGCRGKQRIRYFSCQACGGCRTSRFGTPLYWLKTPLARITMVMTAMSEGVDISAATRVAAQSKLILALHIGLRSSADAHHLLHQVWQRLAPGSPPIFTSDGLNQYFYGITAHFGFWDKPPRARKHHWFPDIRLQYAQLRKRRRGWRVCFLYSIIR